MSFWSKIGLADATMVAELQKEIAELRSENERLAALQSQAQSSLLSELKAFVSGCDDRLLKLKSAAEESDRHHSENITGLSMSLRQEISEKAAQISSNQQNLMKMMEQLPKTQETVEGVEKTLLQYWELIKLLYVNDLLDDLEKR